MLNFEILILLWHSLQYVFFTERLSRIMFGSLHIEYHLRCSCGCCFFLVFSVPSCFLFFTFLEYFFILFLILFSSDRGLDRCNQLVWDKKSINQSINTVVHLIFMVWHSSPGVQRDKSSCCPPPTTRKFAVALYYCSLNSDSTDVVYITHVGRL